MLSINTEIMYWRKNKLWYRYDEKKDIFELTDEATDRAKASFEMWKKFNKIKY